MSLCLQLQLLLSITVEALMILHRPLLSLGMLRCHASVRLPRSCQCLKLVLLGHRSCMLFLLENSFALCPTGQSIVKVIHIITGLIISKLVQLAVAPLPELQDFWSQSSGLLLLLIILVQILHTFFVRKSDVLRNHAKGPRVMSSMRTVVQEISEEMVQVLPRRIISQLTLPSKASFVSNRAEARLRITAVLQNLNAAIRNADCSHGDANQRN
mmetsp:Transcript_46440/g.92920  ORF Transcript_46440/g.92920 Transcript_46440/m.92920 type:complete len:213 (-) Transcript_46440:53-691(-)